MEKLFNEMEVQQSNLICLNVEVAELSSKLEKKIVARNSLIRQREFTIMSILDAYFGCENIIFCKDLQSKRFGLVCNWGFVKKQESGSLKVEYFTPIKTKSTQFACNIMLYKSIESAVENGMTLYEKSRFLILKKFIVF